MAWVVVPRFNLSEQLGINCLLLLFGNVVCGLVYFGPAQGTPIHTFVETFDSGSVYFEATVSLTGAFLRFFRFLRNSTSAYIAGNVIAAELLDEASERTRIIDFCLVFRHARIRVYQRLTRRVFGCPILNFLLRVELSLFAAFISALCAALLSLFLINLY